MPRRFPHCAFGPFALRGLLRAKLLPGEVVVGWGSVERAAEGPMKTLQIGLGMTPMIGPLLALLFTHPRRRFVVLTDNRVIVLDARSADRSTGLRVVAETPLGALRVTPGREPRVFRIALDDEDPAQVVGIPEQRSAPAERLHDALRLLAREPEDELRDSVTPSASPPPTRDRTTR